MKKENTYCLAQRVKAAVMLQPSLIEDILRNPTTNVDIVESTIRRLLPYRTSVEIEHIGSKLLSHEYLIRSLNNEHFKGYIGYDCGDTETKLSLYNTKGLPNFYKALEVLKTYSKVDISGSIHVHVDITNWLTNSDKKYKHIIGIIILGCMTNNQKVDNFCKEILLKSAQIAYPNKSFENLFSDKGEYENTNNTKELALLNMEYLTDHGVIRNIARNIKRVSNNELKDIWNKKNWINIRGDFKSIEIRTFPCSFDYETIIQFMIESNKLVKRILQISEYLGDKAIRNDYVI